MTYLPPPPSPATVHAHHPWLLQFEDRFWDVVMKPHNFTNDYAMERGTLAMMRGFSYSWYSLALMTIVVTGIIFNTLVLTVLWSRRLSSVSTVSYLSALALFDTLALLVNMGGCVVKYVDFFSVFSRTVWWCRATYIVSTTVYTCASWIVVMVAIERMLIVAYPHKAEAILNVAGEMIDGRPGEWRRGEGGGDEEEEEAGGGRRKRRRRRRK